MFAHLTGWHALIIIGVIVLLFGAAKLPGLARSAGQSARILRAEARADACGTDALAADAPAVAAPASTPPPARTGATSPG